MSQTYSVVLDAEHVLILMDLMKQLKTKQYGKAMRYALQYWDKKENKHA